MAQTDKRILSLPVISFGLMFLGVLFFFNSQAFGKPAPPESLQAMFGRVLEDPDNIEINLEYAKLQVKEGDLVGASSTLERILLADPRLAKARLMYAVVLFRLDNLHEAENEFKSLREIRMPSLLRREIEGYLMEIKSRRRRTRMGLRQSVAFQYDSNRNAAPSSKQRLFADLRLPVSRQNGRQGDTSFLNITTVDISHDLGFQAGHELIGSFTYFLAEQTELDALDLSNYQQEYGVAFKNRYVNVTPTVFIQNILLSRETFMRSQGGSLLLDHAFGSRLQMYAQGRLARQDFVDITENLAAHERRGDRLDAALGLRYALLEKLRFSFQYSVAGKDAKEEYNAYNSNVFGLGLTALPGKGQFLTTMLDFGFDQYEAPDLALANRRRRDNTLQVRVIYGAPLSFFLMGKFLPSFMSDTVLSVTYEYDRSLSNVTNYTYKNNKVQTMLSKRLEI